MLMGKWQGHVVQSYLYFPMEMQTNRIYLLCLWWTHFFQQENCGPCVFPNGNVWCPHGCWLGQASLALPVLKKQLVRADMSWLKTCKVKSGHIHHSELTSLSSHHMILENSSLPKADNHLLHADKFLYMEFPEFVYI